LTKYLNIIKYEPNDVNKNIYVYVSTRKMSKLNYDTLEFSITFENKTELYYKIISSYNDFVVGENEPE